MLETAYPHYWIAFYQMIQNFAEKNIDIERGNWIIELVMKSKLRSVALWVLIFEFWSLSFFLDFQANLSDRTKTVFRVTQLSATLLSPRVLSLSWLLYAVLSNHLGLLTMIHVPKQVAVNNTPNNMTSHQKASLSRLIRISHDRRARKKQR